MSLNHLVILNEFKSLSKYYDKITLIKFWYIYLDCGDHKWLY